MRKRWQERRGNVLNFLGGSGSGSGAGVGVAVDDGSGGDDEQADGPDTSYRSGQGGGGWMGGPGDAGVVGHPVMLEDPASLGYDSAAFRQNPHGAKRGKARPTVTYVSREALQKRKIKQVTYLIASLSIVFLFMFLLEQRKLSHYAMVESPVSLGAYLAGEQLTMETGEGKKKFSLGDLGLEEFGKVQVAQVEFGSNNVEVDPDDPIANDELASDPFVGGGGAAFVDYSQVVGDERFDLLRTIVVASGATSAETFLDSTSPQHRALHWLAHEDVRRYTPDNEHWMKKIVQRYTLATVYYATMGEGWTNTLFFLSNYDECNWNRKYNGFFAGAGHCEGGMITALCLWGNNLGGALPPEIGSLTTVRTLSVFDNKLNAPPPESISNLKSLSRLYLQRNDFRDVDINYLCPTPAKEFKADCGKRKGVTCDCCTSCGFNAKNDKGEMLERFGQHF